MAGGHPVLWPIVTRLAFTSVDQRAATSIVAAAAP